MLVLGHDLGHELWDLKVNEMVLVPSKLFVLVLIQSLELARFTQSVLNGPLLVEMLSQNLNAPRSGLVSRGVAWCRVVSRGVAWCRVMLRGAARRAHGMCAVQCVCCGVVWGLLLT